MKTDMLPAFNPGAIVTFKYGQEDEDRVVTFGAMRASAEDPKTHKRTWLLVGTDAAREGKVRSFHWAKIRKFRIVKGA